MKRWINVEPARPVRAALGLLPFVLLVVLYLVASEARLAENPNDKLLPAPSSFVEAIDRMAFQEDRRTGKYLLWSDTAASLKRLGMGVGFAAAIGLTLGLINGAFPAARMSLSPLVTVISLIPPLAILPILFIVFGLDELSKVMLIVIGVAPFIVRDLQARTLELPVEQLIKAQTLGANSWQVVLRVMLPQILPRLIGAVRLSLGTAWLFLIAAEAIASQEGLGYRIFLVRRYLAMDVILPYVAWITLLAFLTDWFLAQISRRCFPWYHDANGGRA